MSYRFKLTCGTCGLSKMSDEPGTLGDHTCDTSAGEMRDRIDLLESELESSRARYQRLEESLSLEYSDLLNKRDDYERIVAELEAMTKRAESAEKLLGEYTSSRHEHGEFLDIGQLSDVEIRRATFSRIEQLQAELEAVKRERDELREENHKLSEALEYHMPPLIASFRDEITTNARKLLAERKKP